VLSPFAFGSRFVCGIWLPVLRGGANDSSFIEVIAAHTRAAVLVRTCDHIKARLPPAAVGRFNVEVGCVRLSKLHVTILNIANVRLAAAFWPKDGLPIKRFSARGVCGGVLGVALAPIL